MIEDVKSDIGRLLRPNTGSNITLHVKKAMSFEDWDEYIALDFPNWELVGLYVQEDENN